MHLSLGIDIGGTKIKSLILESPSNTISYEYQIDSNARLGPKAVQKAIQQVVQYYLEKKIDFASIGIGCAGSVCPKEGIVFNSPNFSDWKDIPLKAWVESDFKKSTTVNNDANCAIFTEWKMGNAQHVTNAVLLTFGTGIGGGLIINNSLYTGSTGSAAELGHFTIHSDGVFCSCGNIGCFERYCSASALERMLPGYSPKTIFANAKKNEEPFKQILNIFLKDIKIALIGIANIFDPDVILIGGGLSTSISDYLSELQEEISKHAFPQVSKRTKVLKTKFDNHSGAIGAALLALEKST